MAERRLKHFGWGREGEGMTPEEEAFALQRLGKRFGMKRFEDMPTPRLEEINLGATRLTARVARVNLFHRALRPSGAYLWQGLPRLCARAERRLRPGARCGRLSAQRRRVAAVLDWAGGKQAAVTPFGAGSSVVGGVEPRSEDRSTCNPADESIGRAYPAAVGR
jgi:alkyldihydroxyacetonephosphate synthase